MASALLHIKDSYYFEVPKALWRVDYQDKSEFPDVWVRLDPQFQLWEAERLYEKYAELKAGDVAPWPQLKAEYVEWKHDHANEGKPFARFLRDSYDPEWVAEHEGDADWIAAKAAAGDLEAFREDSSIQWAPEKIEGYNTALSGKILIPQPFGELKNLYEPATGFCLSKFMIIQVVVAILLFLVFAWLARRVGSGDRPRGRLWNLLEAMVVFIRDQIARPAIGKHDADRFVPLLLTLFFFILGLNLAGMVPWVGAPTSAWAVTGALALITFGTVVIFGMMRFGPLGFFANQIPSMDLPFPIGYVIKPAILAIELLGLCIKHVVLSVRLLANMVAGHLVLLAIMLMAFSIPAALSPAWPFAAGVTVLGTTTFSLLELFVAFLQAYVFTFLSALFIGASLHHH